MPLVLTNAHSHEFEFEHNGRTRRISVVQGQGLPEDLPTHVVTKLAAEYVVSPNGETRVPKYTYQEVVPTETYTPGSVTAGRAEASFEQDTTPREPAPQPTPEEVQQRMEEAERALVLEDRAAEAAREAEVDVYAPQETEEAAEPAADKRAVLRAKLKEAGVSYHPAMGEAKLQALLDAHEDAQE